MGRSVSGWKRWRAPTCSFLGRLPQQEVNSWLERCRAYVYAGLEDFGIAPVEAMAAGAPVIGLGQGGLLDSVRCISTGVRAAHRPAVCRADAGSLVAALEHSNSGGCGPSSRLSRCGSGRSVSPPALPPAHGCRDGSGLEPPPTAAAERGCASVCASGVSDRRLGACSAAHFFNAVTTGILYRIVRLSSAPSRLSSQPEPAGGPVAAWAGALSVAATLSFRCGAEPRGACACCCWRFW